MTCWKIFFGDGSTVADVDPWTVPGVLSWLER